MADQSAAKLPGLAPTPITDQSAPVAEGINPVDAEMLNTYTSALRNRA